MEFKYNLNTIFRDTITKIGNTLLPSDYALDCNSAQICISQIANIIDAMGEASAKAQDLQATITTADKMRHSDHTLYLMIERDDNNNRGSVVGLLKIGFKNLFLYDKTGMVHEKKTLCILDFYVHESKQRSGYGKMLYDYMLQDTDVEPSKLAIDKPTEKFLSFMHKHYKMDNILPQNNNFVLFEGYFNSNNGMNGSLSPNLKSTSPDRMEKDNRNCFDNHSVQSSTFTTTEYGRHAAYKPHDTMTECLGWTTAAP